MTTTAGGGIAASPSGTRGDFDIEELLFQFNNGTAPHG